MHDGFGRLKTCLKYSVVMMNSSDSTIPCLPRLAWQFTSALSYDPLSPLYVF